MPRDILTLHKVSYAFGSKPAIEEVSLTLKAGEVTALIGPSGAGKSTLLRLVAGMHRLLSGHIGFDHQTLSSDTQHLAVEARNIGMIFQDFALFPHLTARENIAFGLRHHSKQQRNTLSAMWLERMQLTQCEKSYPHQLSGGEQQRVALARALAPEPRALLLDEPFSGLDPALRPEVRHIILSELRQADIPALMVTHDPFEALNACDQLAVMDKGRLLQAGPGHQIYSAPGTLSVMRALGPVQTLLQADIPPGWRSVLPQSEKYYARAEAFCISSETAEKFRVDRIIAAPLCHQAELSLNTARITALLPPGLQISEGQHVGVRLDTKHIHSF